MTTPGTIPFPPANGQHAGVATLDHHAGAQREHCPHADVGAVAVFSDLDRETLDERGIPLRPPLGRTELPSELALLRVTGALGVCRSCRAPVVSIRMADYENRTVAWTVRWTPAIRDGGATETRA